MTLEASAQARWPDRMPFLAAVVVFAGLSILCATTSSGFLEADGCTHYLYARFAFAYPAYFVDIWGRPLKTALYAPAAATLGLVGVRGMSLAIAVAVAVTAYTLAKGQRYRWPALAGVFVLAQPLVFLHSFSELTELPFALLLGLAFLAYQRQQWWAVTLLCGLSPLGRPEGFGIVALAGCVLAYHRRWTWLPILAAPVLGWQVAGAVLYREPQHWWNWLPRHWPYAGDSAYQPGPLWHFLVLMPAVVGPLTFPLTCCGLFARRTGTAADERHLRRCDAMIVALPLIVFVGHSVLFALGKMASNGEIRYMLVVAPFWALLGCRGMEWFWQTFVLVDGRPVRGWRSPYWWAGVLAIAPVTANSAYQVLPLVQTEDWRQARRIAEWYESSDTARDYPRLLVSHPGFFYFLDIAPVDPRVVEWTRDAVLDPPDGTLVVWHHVYGAYNADRRKVVAESALASAGYVEGAAAGRVGDWVIVRSARRADGTPSTGPWPPETLKPLVRSAD
jgi:hypothetical protein